MKTSRLVLTVLLCALSLWQDDTICRLREIKAEVEASAFLDELLIVRMLRSVTELPAECLSPEGPFASPAGVKVEEQ